MTRKKKNEKRIALYLFLAVLCLSIRVVFAQQEKAPLPSEQGIKNVILFIGDGMGLSHIAAARMKSGGVEGMLNMERMPVTGLLYTNCANALVTDSAAASTALATGHKTNYRMVSMSPDGKNLPTILEALQERGFATGMVVTESITNATPAGFASHAAVRSSEQEIAEQYIEKRVNVLLGGGRQFFLPQSIQGGVRNDDKNLIELAKNAGYAFVTTTSELAEVKSDYVLGLFASGKLSQSPQPDLAEMTNRAMQILSRNKKGFFLMVEGSQIDLACHSSKLDEAVRQTVLFDEAVKAGLDFALKDKQTLVIVTADHETGGLSINAGTLDGKYIEAGWAGEGNHTAVPVPIFAFGPGAEKFMGVNHLVDVPKKIAELLGIKNFPQ